MTAEAQRTPIKAYSRMKEIMTGYYMGAKMAEGTQQKLAWITSGAPVEILYAAGIIPIYPENHAAMCGATKMADALLDEAEKLGYCRELCSYARTDLASIHTGVSPIPGGLPKPDLLVCCNNICGTVIKWYEELQRIFGVPLVIIDAPFQYGVDDEEHAVDYMEEQLRELIEIAALVTEKPFSWDQLMATLDLSDRAADLWRSVQALMAHRPAPMNSFDTFIHLGPIVTLRGTPICIEYYEQLLAEIKERVEQGIAAVPGERFRLGWDNIAIWHHIKELSNAFAAARTALVVSTYAESFCYKAPDRCNDRFRQYAATYIGGYINHGLEYRLRDLKRMADVFHLDGFVMHSNRSCRAYSIGQYELARELEERWNLPTLIIESDMNDSRIWAEENITTRIEAFVETLSVRNAAAR